MLIRIFEEGEEQDLDISLQGYPDEVIPMAIGFLNKRYAPLKMAYEFNSELSKADISDPIEEDSPVIPTLIFDEQDDALHVYDEMKNIIRQYGFVTYADVRNMIGEDVDEGDEKIGWNDSMHGTRISLNEEKQYYEMILPTPQIIGDMPNEKKTRS